MVGNLHTVMTGLQATHPKEMAASRAGCYMRGGWLLVPRFPVAGCCPKHLPSVRLGTATARTQWVGSHCISPHKSHSFLSG
jgi:hypothetical protein